jgi:hypothetical protein
VTGPKAAEPARRRRRILLAPSTSWQLVSRINELPAANQALTDKLARTEVGRDNLQNQLTEAQDDLISARQALRNMMRDQNRAEG